jgi:hypothetical protein
LVQTEAWRRERKLLEIYAEEVESEMSMRSFVMYGWDKVGRALLWVKAKNYDPKKTDSDRVQRYMTFVLDRLCSK